MQYECGNAYVVLQLSFFYVTLASAVVAPIVTIWAATTVSNDNDWGRGTLALLVMPSFLGPMFMLLLMDRVGTITRIGSEQKAGKVNDQTRIVSLRILSPK